jgi:hypothetical protein
MATAAFFDPVRDGAFTANDARVRARGAEDHASHGFGAELALKIFVLWGARGHGDRRVPPAGRGYSARGDQLPDRALIDQVRLQVRPEAKPTNRAATSDGDDGTTWVSSRHWIIRTGGRESEVAETMAGLNSARGRAGVGNGKMPTSI